jgi:hypothetical protein
VPPWLCPVPLLVVVVQRWLCPVPLLVVVVQLADVIDAAPVGRKQQFRLHCRVLLEDVVLHFARQRVCGDLAPAQLSIPLSRRCLSA